MVCVDLYFQDRLSYWDLMLHVALQMRSSLQVDKFDKSWVLDQEKRYVSLDVDDFLIERHKQDLILHILHSPINNLVDLE